MTEKERQLIDKIEAIRAEANTRWMNQIRIGMEIDPERTKANLRQIHRLDGEVRRCTMELAGSDLSGLFARCYTILNENDPGLATEFFEAYR